MISLIKIEFLLYKLFFNPVILIGVCLVSVLVFVFLMFSRAELIRFVRESLLSYSVRAVSSIVILLGIVLIVFVTERGVGCGNHVCEQGEVVESCPQDCTHVLLPDYRECVGLGEELCLSTPYCQAVYKSEGPISGGGFEVLLGKVLETDKIFNRPVSCVKRNLPSDLKCGDGLCEEGETEETCSQDCLVVCPDVYVPVCGEDGKGYPNCCYARKGGTRVRCQGGCSCEDKKPDLECGAYNESEGSNSTCFQNELADWYKHPEAYTSYLNRIQWLNKQGILAKHVVWHINDIVSKRDLNDQE